MPRIQGWIEEGRSKNWICKQINCRPRTLDEYLKKNAIIYKGNQGGRGFKPAPNKISDDVWLEENLVKNSNQISSRVRNRLISSGIKEKKCESCGRVSWENQEIPLDLHHINGDRFDNRLENLKILCKNCHGLTETYSVSLKNRK